MRAKGEIFRGMEGRIPNNKLGEEAKILCLKGEDNDTLQSAKIILEHPNFLSDQIFNFFKVLDFFLCIVSLKVITLDIICVFS